MNQKLLTFDGRSLGTESVEVPGRLRWACWNAGGSALLVGDRGAALIYREGKFRRLSTGVDQNLRCAEFSPDGQSAYICGNSGTFLRTDTEGCDAVETGLRANLRRLGWSHGGVALVVGNDGEAFTFARAHLERIQGSETNLRSVVWHPRDDYALVSGNCFRASVGSLTPSPNLFRYEAGSLVQVQDIPASRDDLTAASWRPNGSECLIVGYDQTWHTPAAYIYNEGGLRRVPWGDAHVFPTSCAWHPSGEYAVIGTGLMRDGEGDCALYRYDAGGVSKLFDLGEAGVSSIAWSPQGRALVVASRAVRAYSS